MRIPGAAWAALALSSCSSGAAPARRGDEQAVVEAVMGMYTAFQQRDLAKVGEHMTEGSTCYNATTSEMLVGRKAVLDHFGAILAEHDPSKPWQSSIEGMKVVLSGDLAYANYRVKAAMGGTHAVAAVTHIFRRTGDRWLAVHLHRSWNAQPR
jgi:ketosteroid isomerase-like protein